MRFSKEFKLFYWIDKDHTLYDERYLWWSKKFVNRDHNHDLKLGRKGKAVVEATLEKKNELG